jgi:hypothetical protein
LALVNVRYRGEAVNCVGAELVTENVTLVEGWESRTTVNESAVPASVGAATVLDTVTPADWAIATRECELSSVKRAVKRMANFLAEAGHELPVLAILDNQPSGSSNTQRGMEVRILSVGADCRPDRDVRWGGRRYGLPPLARTTPR